MLPSSENLDRSRPTGQPPKSFSWQASQVLHSETLTVPEEQDQRAMAGREQPVLSHLGGSEEEVLEKSFAMSQISGVLSNSSAKKQKKKQ